MRKIAVITGTRAEYGILKPVLEKILASKKLELSLIVTGMHLMPEYGFTVREIEKDGIPIAARLEMILSSDEMAAMGKSLGIGITGLIQELEHIHPDVVLVLGDRIEAFAGATAGLFQGAVVAHIHGGETTEGGLDEYMRHAITKISHIHFPATPLSRKRILDMGENPDFVYCVGTPGLDALLQFPKYTSRVLENKLGVKIPTKFALFIQHPISTHPKTAAKEIKESLAVLDEQNLPTFAIYPNADAGSREMVHVIKEYEKKEWLTTFLNLPRELYCNLLQRALVLIGNSSSGMIDSPAYGVPVINIGERQKGRERGDNVIDVEPKRAQIKKALQTVLTDTDFIEKASKTENPYGDGKASDRICRTIENVDFKKAKREKWFVPS
jgi:GDP/UDP-N,N'-diacetylbacillosamine 2-epimerase (hydrolysing)